MSNSDSPPSPPAAPTSGCPVHHKPQGAFTPNPSFSWPWSNASDITTRLVDNDEDVSVSPPPALGYQLASVEEAAQHAQTPHPDQRILLGTERQVSSIPRGGLSLNGDTTASTCPVAATAASKPPHHQHDDATHHWVYPSEQQLYNAMRRKGWTNVPEDSISTVLNIHNTINERTWRHIQEWEGSRNLTLTKFQGRPTKLSPKAWLLCNCLRLYDPPFDRHDWYVEHNDTTATKDNDNAKTATTQRYVIDYYYAEDRGSPLPRPIIDARPALDHPRAVLLRSKQFFKDAFPAISKRLFASLDGDKDVCETNIPASRRSE